MTPKNGASGKFKDLSAVGVRIIIKAGDSLIHEEPRFLETWQKYNPHGSSTADPASESYQYAFSGFIPLNIRDHVITEFVTKSCKSFQEKNRFSLTIEIRVLHSYPAL
jgi:hypothetical protein